MAWNGAQWTQQQMAGMAMPAGYEHLTAEQQQAMVTQNWQQWQSYYQQYAQWQAQYGQQYQQELNKLQPPLPDQPPPPPPPPSSSGDGKPPPPPPAEASNAGQPAGQQQQRPQPPQRNQPPNRSNPNMNLQNENSFGYDGPPEHQQQGGPSQFDQSNDRRRNPRNNNNMGGDHHQNNRFENNNNRGRGRGRGGRGAERGRGGDGRGGGRGGRGNDRFNSNRNWLQNPHNNNQQQWNDEEPLDNHFHNQQQQQQFHNNPLHQQNRGPNQNHNFGDGPDNNNQQRGRGNNRGGRRSGRRSNQNNDRNNRYQNQYPPNHQQQQYYEDDRQQDQYYDDDQHYDQDQQQHPQRYDQDQQQSRHYDQDQQQSRHYDQDQQQSRHYDQDQQDQYYDQDQQQREFYDDDQQPFDESQRQFDEPQQQEPPQPSVDQQPVGPTRAQQQQWDKEDDEDERLFDEQFRKWEDQFNNWKVQNQDHPDRNSYIRYEREFEDVRIRLMERRDQMRQRRLSARQEILRSQGANPSNVPPVQQQQQQHPQMHSQNNAQNNQYSGDAPPPPNPQSEDKGRDFPHNRERNVEESPNYDDQNYDDQGNDDDPHASNESVDNLFTRSCSSGAGGGIPGLDLVEPVKEKEFIDGEEVINLEEQEASAERNKRVSEEDQRNQEDSSSRHTEASNDGDRQRSKATKFEVDAENIENILKNPDILSLLNQVNGGGGGSGSRTEDNSSNTPAAPAGPPDVNELLKNANIQGMLNQMQNSLNNRQAPPSIQNPNINDLLQNPNISNLLEQVMGGGQRAGPPPTQQNSNFNPAWNNNSMGNFRGNDPYRNRNEFGGDLPPAFRGNPSALGPAFDNGPNFSGNPNFGGNQNYGGNPNFGGNSNFGDQSFSQPPPHFSGPPPLMQNFQQQHQQPPPQQQYNLLPPAMIHGDRPPNREIWAEPKYSEFRRREQPPTPTKEEILVPTQVVDYQHKSVVEKKPPLDYFHRKDQIDPKPAPVPMRGGASQLNQNVYATQVRTFGGPKRRSRFSDEVEQKRSRPEPDRRGRQRDQDSRNNSRFDGRGRRGRSRDREDKQPSRNRDAPKSHAKKEEPASGKVDDYLEGISDEEIETNDNNETVDMEEDNFSLSSVEDLPDEDPNLVSIKNILLNPGRKQRPRRILIVIRGLPGSGKTHIAKLIKDKEVEMGGSAPRILSIDDYFTTETDEVATCPKTGKDIVTKSMVYEFEPEMEEQYLQYLLKAYKKTISDGYFDFIVVDAVYQKMEPVLNIVSHAKSKGFVSYICSLETDVETCLERNIHSRAEDELRALAAAWEPCPKKEKRLDIQPLLEWSRIAELPVEDISNDEFEDDDDMDLDGDKVKSPVVLSAKDAIVEVKPRSEDGKDVLVEATINEEQVKDSNETVDSKDVEQVASGGGSESENVPVDTVKDENKTKEVLDDTGAVEEKGAVVSDVEVKELNDDPIEDKPGYENEDTAAKNETDEFEEEQEQVDLEAQLQEELDTNFEDLEGDPPLEDEQQIEDEDVEPEPIDESLFKSKWDSDPKEDRLAKMDGISKPLRPPTIEEYLQQDDYLQTFEDVEPGKKRVRWADIEEKKAQDKMRAIGFVVGQTDWNRMMDPTEGQGALTKTKFIDRVRKDDPS